MFQAVRRCPGGTCHAVIRHLMQQVHGQGRCLGSFSDAAGSAFEDGRATLRHSYQQQRWRPRIRMPAPHSPMHHSFTSVQGRHLDGRPRCSSSSAGPGPRSGGSTPGVSSKERYQGLAALLLVAFIWGSYAPVCKYLFLLPRPPSCQLLNASQATISAVLLLAASQLLKYSASKSSSAPGGRTSSTSNTSGNTAANGAEPPSWNEDRHPLPSYTVDASSSNSIGSIGSLAKVQQLVARTLTWQPKSLLVAGCELAIYTCTAITLCTFGLQLTSATKAAFLTQSACLFTPLLTSLAGQRLGKYTWVSSSLGLLGSLLILMDGSGASAAVAGVDAAAAAASAVAAAAAAPPALEVHGQALVLASAVMYSLVTFRMEQSLKRHAPLDLAFTSNSVQAILFCIVLAAPLLFDPGAAAALVPELRGILADGSACAALLWLGAGPGALGAFLQTTGQRRVPAAQAQVVYSTTPLWSALLAAFLLQNEFMGPQAWLGGLAVVAATLVIMLL